MTYLEIMQAVAKNAGIQPPQSLSSTDEDQILLGQLINDAGKEIARRVDWGILRKEYAAEGTGTATDFTLPDDFDRLVLGLSVMNGVNTVRGSLTSDEWLSLAPVAGQPRYFYLRGSLISFYPYLKSGDEATVHYQSRIWTDNGTEKLTVQGDEPLVPSALVVAGAVWRFRRHVGKDFADHVAEFEAMLVDLARNDNGVRSP